MNSTPTHAQLSCVSASHAHVTWRTRWAQLPCHTFSILLSSSVLVLMVRYSWNRVFTRVPLNHIAHAGLSPARHVSVQVMDSHACLGRRITPAYLAALTFAPVHHSLAALPHCTGTFTLRLACHTHATFCTDCSVTSS
jgi:hypothetical protein